MSTEEKIRFVLRMLQETIEEKKEFLRKQEDAFDNTTMMNKASIYERKLLYNTISYIFKDELGKREAYQNPQFNRPYD